MPYLPQFQGQRRAERVRFSDSIPAVLRFADGNRASGKLQVVSVTGGLLCLPRPIQQGAVAKLMFLTSAGSVLGSAQLLTPMSWELQPFRFVGLPEDDQSRLQSAIQTHIDQNKRQSDQLRKSREEFDNFRAW